MIKAIFVDAGHGLGPTGGIDNGAAGNGTTERKEVVAMAQSLAGQLSADPDFRGVQIIKVSVDERLMLIDHIKEVNILCQENQWKSEDALLLSIHVNAASDPAARGLEAWYSPRFPTMIDFAKTLVEQVATTTGLPPRSRPALISSDNRWGRLGILDDTLCVGCLFEAGFLSNEFDAKVLTDAALREKIVDGLHRAIRVQCSLPPLHGPATPPTSFTDLPALAWYREDVKLCLREGLFQMSADGLFHPERPVSRAELATVLARHLRSHHGIQG
ncbi:MAG: N-acetylmuramoyl-L-alanine amidase [Candidatus Peregrinibacteria bacterium]